MNCLQKLFIFIFIISVPGCIPSPGLIRIIPDQSREKIDILYNGTLFTSYLYSSDMEKPVLYPVCTANGTDITRGFPLEPRPGEREDHPHHVGMWFNFGDVNGLDFWNNSSTIPADKKHRYGSIRHSKIVDISERTNTLIVEADWIDHQDKILLKENTHFIFSGGGDWRIVERRTELSALHDTVIFTDNKEGLLAIRMDRAFEEPDGIYRNNNGLEKEGVWGKPANWVTLSAEKAGEEITVAILDHRENPGYPAHSHARGYGLFATNNMGSQVFDKENSFFTLTLNPGESVIFRHLIIVKTGGFITDEEMNYQFSEFNKR